MPLIPIVFALGIHLHRPLSDELYYLLEQIRVRALLDEFRQCDRILGGHRVALGKIEGVETQPYQG
jgi:hypothetical protein